MALTTLDALSDCFSCHSLVRSVSFCQPSFVDEAAYNPAHPVVAVRSNYTFIILLLLCSTIKRATSTRTLNHKTLNGTRQLRKGDEAAAGLELNIF